MHFKSLELIGFKSFAEKTRLDFEPGVTAIVGPNGCGKSNIADSIRWVLGEQSTKSLRASKMEDVIFNGTDTKEPINFAEVSLVLSNEKRILPIDYDEVIITRRVFRSGENEYLLNKTPVRLKDISELLMGTGIGTENYSIIEQGKMDLILSSRSEDRRYIFEEASGITKYKAKKKEALRKLEQTEQNILRINDIIQEVKRQISSIERQARKAERYKVDFDRLKDMEVRLSCLEYRDMRTAEKTFFAEKTDMKEREKDLADESAAMAEGIAAYRESLDELNENASALKTRFASMSNSLNMNLHKIGIDKERIEESRLSQKALKKEMESIGEKLSSTIEAIGALKDALGKLDAEKGSRARSIEEKKTLLDNIDSESREREENLKVCKVNTVDYLTKETKIKNELIKLGADIQNRHVRQRRLAIEKETVEKELEAATEALDFIRRELGDVEKRIAAMGSGLEEKSQRRDLLSSELKTTEDALSKKEKDASAARSKIEFLDDLVKRHEGFKSGVKSLLRAADAESGPRIKFAVLADLIKVDRGYEEAVSTFLGDDAQIIVVEKEEDISKAIAYLKDKGLGKASFISLEMANRNKRYHGATSRDNLTPLRKFVKTDPRYAALVDNLFSGACMVEAIDEGLKERAMDRSFTIVTKAGYMFREGRFSGGSTSDNDESLLIGRRDRLDAMRLELKNIEEWMGSLETDRNKKKLLISALSDEIGSEEKNLHAEEITLSNIRVKQDAQDKAVKKFADELSVIGLEMEELGEAIDDQTKKGEVLNKELNHIEEERSHLQLAIDESQVVIVQNRTRRENLSLEIATLKTEAQSLAREREGMAAGLEKEEIASRELSESLASKNALMEEAKEKAAFLEREIERLKLDNEAISKDLKAAGDSSSAVEKTRSEVVDKLSIAEIGLKEKEREVELLRNQIRDLDVKTAEISYKKTNLKDRIEQSYKVDLETLHVEIEENVDRNALASQISELKEGLERLGPVNLVAIDEHKELEERYGFLVHQQEDLVNAKESLLKAIQKINKTTKELFLDTFQKIQVEFKNFFRLLFGGGQAELFLLDENDVLESGIEIVVRPPGKKLQNIMLLSGGEKALTATSLLFAIFKINPSPFCVLDEIDAPLDESNIVRFSNVLKDFVKMSQFIIITHNKRTIELADVMYGITMQERGISKIVSVKFMDETKKEKEGEAVGAPA